MLLDLFDYEQQKMFIYYNKYICDVVNYINISYVNNIFLTKYFANN